ncbi:MAG: chorismate--pyruvate lyase family protein, partial [Casimicrobiaceae bacterium]
AAWRAETRPQELWPWLAHAGSFTEKLRAAAGNAFHVEVLDEGVTQLGVDEAMSLHALPGAAARRRDAYLCWNEPWVYARTLSATESGHWLDGLGTQPLGERVFAEPYAQRGPIDVARLDAAQPLYRAALKGSPHRPSFLWARRSVLMVRGDRLLIYEAFLTGMEN